MGLDIQYYGPGKRINLLEAGEPVGSDDMEGDINGVNEPNHRQEGGNILRKSGDVFEISEPDWNDLSGTIGGGAPMTKPVGN